MHYQAQEIKRQAQLLQTEAERLEEGIHNDSLAEQLVRRAQRMAVLCREHWISQKKDTPAQSEQYQMGVLEDGWEVTVQSPHVVLIDLPLLLPKRNSPNAGFLTGPLEALLSSQQSRLPHFWYCTVLFRHIYGPELSMRDVRDHDNLETRAVLNVLERYLLVSDSGVYCTNIHRTEAGEQTGTRVILTDRDLVLEGGLLH